MGAYLVPLFQPLRSLLLMLLLILLLFNSGNEHDERDEDAWSRRVASFKKISLHVVPQDVSPEAGPARKA